MSSIGVGLKWPVLLALILAIVLTSLTIAASFNDSVQETSLSVKVYGLSIGDKANLLVAGTCIHDDNTAKTIELDSFTITRPGTIPVKLALDKIQALNCTKLWINLILSAPEYGEVPEEYWIDYSLIKTGKIREVRFYLGEVLGPGKLNIILERLQKGPIGVIGRLGLEANNIVIKGIGLMEEEKTYLTIAESSVSARLRKAAEKAQKTLIIIQPGLKGLNNAYKAIIVDPGKPIWIITSSKTAFAQNNTPPCAKVYTAIEYAYKPEVITETQINREQLQKTLQEPMQEKTETLISIQSLGTTVPLCPILYTTDVAGNPKKVDVLATVDTGERFWNADLWGGLVTPNCNEDKEIDRPLVIVFYDNAEVDKVKNIYWGSTSVHNSQCMKVYDDSYTDGWEWDTDKGTHSSLDGCGWHMRVYAPYPEDRFYDTDFGYFVVATAHHDDEVCIGLVCWECGSYTDDEAEDYLVSLAESKGYKVYRDICYAYNSDISSNTDNKLSYVEIP